MFLESLPKKVLRVIEGKREEKKKKTIAKESETEARRTAAAALIRPTVKHTFVMVNLSLPRVQVCSVR